MSSYEMNCDDSSKDLAYLLLEENMKRTSLDIRQSYVSRIIDALKKEGFPTTPFYLCREALNFPNVEPPESADLLFKNKSVVGMVVDLEGLIIVPYFDSLTTPLGSYVLTPRGIELYSETYFVDSKKGSLDIPRLISRNAVLKDDLEYVLRNLPSAIFKL